MIRSLLIGLVAGQRAMTPLAAISGAARRGTLPHDNVAARVAALPLPAAGAVALAAAEMAGDKMKTAPDRIVPIGLVVRSITGASAGATLAPRGRHLLGAALGATAAVASSYVGWRARMWALRRWGQTGTGVVEDAIVLAGGLAVTGALSPAD